MKVGINKFKNIRGLYEEINEFKRGGLRFGKTLFVFPSEKAVSEFPRVLKPGTLCVFLLICKFFLKFFRKFWKLQPHQHYPLRQCLQQ
jgi:hypothetical protein